MNPTALVLLVLAIAPEVAGTAGLEASEGFGRLGPSALAVLGYALAFYFWPKASGISRWGSRTSCGRGWGPWARSCCGC
jgi:hypothetical protein